MFRETLPSSVLRSIVDRVALDVERQSQQEPLEVLQAKVAAAEPPRDFAGALASGFGLIAEIKRRSPSMGEMRHQNVEQIAHVYAGSRAVRAVSVLTNTSDFGMEIADLQRVRRIVSQPILRKDFIFDEYQIWQARAYGADAILLMANVVTAEGLAHLSRLAESLGLSVLFETHEQSELAKLPAGAKICGINSRRFMAGRGKSTRLAYGLSKALRLIGVRWDLSIDRDHFQMVNALPAGSIKVAESGIDPSMIAHLRDELGFQAMLVGTSILMAERGVKAALQRFEHEIQTSQLSLPLPPDPNALQSAAA